MTNACAKSHKRRSGWASRLASSNDPYFFAAFLRGGGMGSCRPAVISVRLGMWAAVEVFPQI
jgi:hypothetical protein